MAEHVSPALARRIALAAQGFGRPAPATRHATGRGRGRPARPAADRLGERVRAQPLPARVQPGRRIRPRGARPPGVGSARPAHRVLGAPGRLHPARAVAAVRVPPCRVPPQGHVRVGRMARREPHARRLAARRARGQRADARERDRARRERASRAVVGLVRRQAHARVDVPHRRGRVRRSAPLRAVYALPEQVLAPELIDAGPPSRRRPRARRARGIRSRHRRGRPRRLLAAPERAGASRDRRPRRCRRARAGHRARLDHGRPPDGGLGPPTRGGRAASTPWHCSRRSTRSCGSGRAPSACSTSTTASRSTRPRPTGASGTTRCRCSSTIASSAGSTSRATARGVLRVQSAWTEPSAPDDAAERLLPVLRRAADWQGLGEVVVAGRGDLSPAIAALAIAA